MCPSLVEHKIWIQINPSFHGASALTSKWALDRVKYYISDHFVAGLIVKGLK